MASSSSSPSSSTCGASRRPSSCPPPISTTSSTRAPGSPGSPPGRSARGPTAPTWRPCPTRPASRRCPGSRTWPASPATSSSRGSRGRTAPAPSCAGSWRGPRQLGYVFKTGMEAEFFLLRDNNGTIELADPLDTLDRPCYDMKGLTRQYDFITTLSQYQTELGWDNYANDHEDANCQFESNFRYADALTTADRIVFFRYMVQTLAQRAGDAGDVHAQAVQAPDRQRLSHAHPACGTPRPTPSCSWIADDPRGLGHSELGLPLPRRDAGARLGLHRRHRADRQLLQAAAGRGADSGATWSPVFVTYGGNNRTQMIRMPAPGRFEDRTVDGSCNPYLAATVVLASGLDGIENKIDPGDPNRDNLYAIPPTRSSAGASASCPATCSTPPAISWKTVSCAGPRPDRPRRLHRLLRPGEADGVERVPRAGHRLGDEALPGPLLDPPVARPGIRHRERPTARQGLVGGTERRDRLHPTTAARCCA